MFGVLVNVFFEEAALSPFYNLDLIQKSALYLIVNTLICY